jgi:hypothetical protein
MYDLEYISAIKCRACDKILTDLEALEKCPVSGEFEDMCFHCIALSEDDEYMIVEREI